MGIIVLLWPWQVEAHLVTTGLGPVYDGVGHLLLTPEDLVPIIALALFAGLRGASYGRWTLFLLPVAWLAGGFLGLHASWSSIAMPVPAISFLTLGILVAADVRLRPVVVAALAIALGLIHGLLNGMAIRSAGASGMELIGVAATIFVIVALMAAFVVSLKRPWTRIVVRVAGSWVTAIGLLLLGWSLRGA